MIAMVRAIIRGRRLGLLRLKRAAGPVALDCVGGACGLCCSAFGGGVVVTASEASILPLTALRNSGGGIVLASRDNGSCSLLDNKQCTEYSQRPRGCREYPWYRFRDELYYDAGCPGITASRDERPNPSALAHGEDYFPVIAPIRWLILGLLKRW